MKPPLPVELVWDNELVFHGTSNHARMTLDSAGIAGPSPVQALAFGLAGCMGMDLVHILRKGRHDLRALAVALIAERAPNDPHRIVAVDLQFRVTGNVPGDQIQRALDLSHDRYCSVWHSMRQDIHFRSSYTQVRPAE